MAGRVPDRIAGGRDADAESEDGQAGGRPEAAEGREALEREKAETEIAAGDVADDLADFA